MNKCVFMGRPTRDPEIRYSQNENGTAIARYTLAVARLYKRQGEPDADFINCVAFGKLAELAEKYIRQGMRLVVSGRLQTGNYTNKDGIKVYTTDLIIEDQEFAENKPSEPSQPEPTNTGKTTKNSKTKLPPSQAQGDGYMNIPDSLDEELPFN